MRETYLRRAHQEQIHRFLKWNLLATAYQTPEVQHEEQWWRIPVLACFQLRLARKVGSLGLRPW